MIRILHYSFALCCKKSTRGPLSSFRLTLLSWIVLFCLTISSWTGNARGQVFDSFDEPTQKFFLWQDDAKAFMLPFKKTEPGIETIETSFGVGSKVYLVYPIEPCAIIDDLNASINILSAQSGLRIGLRVVFPRSANVATHPLIKEVLLGTPSEGRGKWSKSTIASFGRQLEERILYLRTKHGPNIDLQDAYVDAVVLSIYSDPGTIKLKVDDLSVEGMVAPTSAPSSTNAATQQLERAAPITLSVQEQLRQIQASVPRWILHQGESLYYLKELGFNAVITNNPNDSLIVEQALGAQMGVIARPPELVPTEELASNYRHIQGWLIGTTLDHSNLPQTRSVVSKLSRFPPNLARPTVGEAMELYSSYSRYSDLLAIPQPIATRVSSSKEASAIMQSDLRPLAGRSLPLTSIVTQMPVEWRVQKEFAQRALGREGNSVDYDLLQVRLQFYRSMMQGARGFIFRSGSPLDSGEPTSLMRSKGYASINREIDLLMPWIQAGQSSWRNVATDSPNHTAAILETPKSQLAIVMASGPMDQICSTAPNTERIRVTLPMSRQLRDVFRITHGYMEKLRVEQIPEGLRISIEQPSIIEQIVAVNDPMPVAYLNDKLQQHRASFVDSRFDITQQVLDLGQMTLISQQVPNMNSDPRWEEIERARALQRAAEQYLVASNLQNALKSTDQALLSAQRVLRGSWEEAMSRFSALQSSPLVASPLSLPLHWEFNRLLRGRNWQTLSIPGFPFQNDEQFQKSQWKVDRRLMENIDSLCAVGPNGPDGNPTLWLSAKPLRDNLIPSGYGGAVMRVSSPAIEVPEGAMINIQGVVRIQSPANETQSGLLVCDSIGGESLGQLISSTDESPYSWRRFSLIRFVGNQRSCRIHFETRGEMQAEIAGLEISMLIPASSSRIPTRPYSPEEAAAEQSNALPVSYDRAQP